MVSEHTKSNKSNLGRNEFLHVFSTEFLTKEGIERDEKVVLKVTSKSKSKTPIKVIEDDFTEKPKILSQTSEKVPIMIEMKRNHFEDHE